MFAITLYKDSHLYAVGVNSDNNVIIEDFKTYKPKEEEIRNLVNANNKSIQEMFIKYFKQDFRS